jgi:hypothetical protein
MMLSAGFKPYTAIPLKKSALVSAQISTTPTGKQQVKMPRLALTAKREPSQGPHHDHVGLNHPGFDAPHFV